MLTGLTTAEFCFAAGVILYYRHASWTCT